MPAIDEVIINKCCTGCGACVFICPKEAVSIKKSNMGRLFAYIDESKCVECNLCSRVCPNTKYGAEALLQDKKNFFIGNITKVCVGHSNNREIYKNAQSGGIVTQILYSLFERGIIDAAITSQTCFNKNSHNEPVIITRKEDLTRTQKSFYSPISLLAALRSAKSYKSVAIVGLPCQVEAIRLIEKAGKAKNIKYIIGLICDRCISETWNDVILKYFDITNRDVKIVARDKSAATHKNAYKYAPMVIKSFGYGSIITSNYLRLALKDYFTPPRCRICFDKLNIFADIVCGDPWGMQCVDWQHGDSVVITRTQIGNELVEDLIADDIITLNEAEKNELIEGQKIQERINNISNGIKIFQECNWVLPNFIPIISTEMKPPVHDKRSFKLLRNSIKRYIKYEKLPKDRIISKVYRQIRMKAMIQSYKSSIRKIYHLIIK